VRLHALRVIKKHHLDRHRDLRSLLARRFVAERNAALRRDRRPGQGHGHAFGRGQSSDHAFGRGHGQGHGHAFGRGHSSGRCH
jgi:hypothetical protein